MFWRKKKEKETLESIDFGQLSKNVEVNCVAELELKASDEDRHLYFGDRYRLIIKGTLHIQVPELDWNYQLGITKLIYNSEEPYMVYEKFQKILNDKSDERKALLFILKEEIQKDVMEEITKQKNYSIKDMFKETHNITIIINTSVDTSEVNK